MKYTYKATDKEGNEYENTVELENRFEVYALVRKEGGTVISVEEAGHSLKSIDMDTINAFLAKVKIPEKVLFARNLGAMLSAGLSLSRALEVMNRQTKNFKLKQVLTSIKDDIAKGNDLNTAMAKHEDVFPKLMVSMVKAGEESGQLSETLRVVADQMEKVYELQRKIKGAMIYPAIIISALLIIGVLMMIFIVPTLTATFEDLAVELPTSTKVVIAISDFLQNNTIGALILGVVTLATFMWGVKTPIGRKIVNTVVLYIPMIRGIVKESQAARTGRTLSSLLSAGVQVLQAFEITEEVVQNHHFKRVLAQAREQVQTGSQISEVFRANEHLYPPLVGELVAVGEETGKLPDMFGEIAKFYEAEVDQKTENISTFVEPFLMLVVGAGVGFFAVSMLSPIYSITSSIQ